MTKPTVKLIDNAAVTGADFDFSGGEAQVMVEATAWNGATVTIEAKTPNGTYIPFGSDTTFTANGQAGFDCGECTIHASITGGPPTGVRVYLKKINRVS